MTVDQKSLLLKRLDQLDYSQYTFDYATSGQIVSRLVSDLTGIPFLPTIPTQAALETAKKFRSDLDDAEQQIFVLKEQVVPLKNEIQRVTQENNSLHLKVVQYSESEEHTKYTSTRLLKRVENEASDLKFLCSQYAVSLQAQQQKYDTLKEQMDKLLQMHVAETKREGGKREKKRLRVPKIDMETGLEPLAYTPTHPYITDTVALDILKTTELRVDVLQQEKDEILDKYQNLENQVGILETKLLNRDTEIQRIGTQLERTRLNQFQDIGEMTGDVIITAEQAASRYPLVKQRVEQLEYQIEHLHDYCNALEIKCGNFVKDREAIVQAHDKEREVNHSVLEREKEHNKVLISNVHALEKMVSELDRQVNVKKGGLSQVTIGKKSEAPKTQTIKRISELQEKVTEYEKRIKLLQQQLQNSKSEVEVLLQAKQDLNNEVEEKQRIIYALENEKAIVKEDKLQSTEESEKVALSVQKNMDTEKDTHFVNSNTKHGLVNQIEKLTREKDDLKSKFDETCEQLSEANNEYELLKKTADMLENENIELHQKLLNLQEEFDQLSLTNQDTQTKLEICNTERDQFITSLGSLEIQLEQIIQQVEKLKLEKENYKKLYIESSSRTTPKMQPNTPMIIKPLVELSTVDEALSACDLANEKINESDHALMITDLNAEIQTFKEQITQYQKTIQTLQQKQSIYAHLTTPETQSPELQFLRQELEDLKHAMQDKMCVMRELEENRESLQNETDIKAEVIADLQEKMKVWKKEYESHELECISLREEKKKLEFAIEEKMKEVSGLEKRYGAIMQEKEGLKERLSVQDSEIKCLRRDFEGLNSEYTLLQGDMTQVFQERENYKTELQDCEKHTQELEAQMKEKDHERHQTMISYRKLIIEHERMDMKFCQLDEMCSTLKMEIMMREKNIQGLQDALEESQADILKLKGSLHLSEKHSNSLSQSLSAAERTITHLEGDKARLMREVSASRDLSNTIERSKHDVHERVMSLSMEVEQMQGYIHRVEAEKESIADLLKSEKLKVDRLEHVVLMERTKSLKAEQDIRAFDDVQGSIEDKMNTISQHQSASFLAVSKELRQAQDDLKSMRDRIRTLENELNEKRKEFQLTVDKMEISKKECLDLKLELDSKDKIIQDLKVAILSPSIQHTPSSVKVNKMEDKLQYEINKTKQELEQYEIEIASRYSKSTHASNTPSRPDPMVFHEDRISEGQTMNTLAHLYKDIEDI